VAGSLTHGGGHPVAPALYRKGPAVALTVGQLTKKLDEVRALVGSDYPVVFLSGPLDPNMDIDGPGLDARDIEAVVLMHPLNSGTMDYENHTRAVYLIALS
jgi:hypothetical protein